MLFKKGFSLIELLAVVGLMAVLMALLFPMISKARGVGERAKAANHMRQVVMAYQNYVQLGTGHRVLMASTAQEWAGVLARYEGFNEAELFYIESDGRLMSHQPLPGRILDNVHLGAKAQITSEFANVPISYAVVSHLSARAHPSTTPIMWTRGLMPSGHWAEDSPYQGRGGHIGFLDGHVAWYSDVCGADGKGIFTHATQGYATMNIQEALPAGSYILNGL